MANSCDTGNTQSHRQMTMPFMLLITTVFLWPLFTTNNHSLLSVTRTNDNVIHGANNNSVFVALIHDKQSFIALSHTDK